MTSLAFGLYTVITLLCIHDTAAFLPTCVHKLYIHKHSSTSRSERVTMGLGDWANSIPGKVGKFVRMGEEGNDVPTPACVLVGGLPLEEINTLQNVLTYQPHPMLILTEDMLSITLGDALSRCEEIAISQKRTGFENLRMVDLQVPVIVISGYENDDLRFFISSYKESTDFRPAFAKAVPNAMSKRLDRLVGEIGNDHQERLAAASSSSTVSTQ